MSGTGLPAQIDIPRKVPQNAFCVLLIVNRITYRVHKKHHQSKSNQTKPEIPESV